jgi:hypothetical protein
MLRDPKAILIVAASLITLAAACKLLIPRDFPWRIPGGWPLGSHYERMDNIAFRILFSLGIFAAFLGLLRALARLRS